MLGKIKYSYIPKAKSMDAILSSLAYAVKATGALDYKLIDSIAGGIRIYPEEIKDNVIMCHHEDLKKTIKQLVKQDIEIIILNGFSLDLDEIKNDFCQIVEEYDIMLCVNKLTDLKNGNNISVVIEPEVHKLEDEEWESVKQEILDNLEQAKEGVIEKPKKDDLSSLLELFGLGDIYNKSDEDEKDNKKTIYDFDEDEIDIEEQYSHTIANSELYVSLTSSNEILIELNEEYVVIPKTQVAFLVDTLQKLVK